MSLRFELRRSVTTLGRKAWTWPCRSMAQLWCQLPTAAVESDTTSQRILGNSGSRGSSWPQGTMWFCKGLNFNRNKLKSNGSLWFIVIPWMTLQNCLKNSSSRHFLEERHSSRRWKAACQRSSDFETSDEITALKITKFACTWKSIISCAAHQTHSSHSQKLSQERIKAFPGFTNSLRFNSFVISPPARHRPSTNSLIRLLSFQRSPHLVIAPSENRLPVAKSLTVNCTFSFFFQQTKAKIIDSSFIYNLQSFKIAASKTIEKTQENVVWPSAETA